MTDLTKAEKYYKKRGLVDTTVKGAVRGKSEIVYGAKAVNAQMPEHLKTYTLDWDIATTDDPEQIANKIEKKLDTRYGGNYFRVEPAVHPGTFKIKSNVTGKGLVDVTAVSYTHLTLPTILLV